MRRALLDFTKPHVLRTEAEYEAAITEIERHLGEDVEAGSEGYDRLEFLSVLVEHYEDTHYPMSSVSPQQAVLFMLEQKGLERSELGRMAMLTWAIVSAFVIALGLPSTDAQRR